MLQWKMLTRKQMQCDGQHCLTQAALGQYRCILASSNTVSMHDPAESPPTPPPPQTR